MHDRGQGMHWLKQRIRCAFEMEEMDLRGRSQSIGRQRWNRKRNQTEVVKVTLLSYFTTTLNTLHCLTCNARTP